jgi:hypothetical protein
MNRAVFSLIVLNGAGYFALAVAAFARSADAPPKELGAVLEASEVRLENPAVFWRAGEQESTTTGILLRVRVNDPFLFAPRGAMPPLFVYGSAVCEVLRNPMVDGEAVLLAPHILPGEAPVLWLANVSEPRSVDKKLVALSRPKGAELTRGAGLMVTGSKGEGRVYKDVDELREEIRSRASKPPR